MVYPETLSNKALTSENSPPHITYGSMPNRNDNIHESTMIMNPSCSDMASDFLTKIKGNAPAIKVIIKLMDNGAKAESIPSPIDISMEMNMNSALTRSALPTLVDITLTFIFYP